MAAGDWLSRSDAVDIGRELTDLPDVELGRRLDDAAKVPPPRPTAADGSRPPLPPCPADAIVRWDVRAGRLVYFAPDVLKLYQRTQVGEQPAASEPAQAAPVKSPEQRRSLPGLGVLATLERLIDRRVIKRDDTLDVIVEKMCDADPELKGHRPGTIKDFIRERVRAFKHAPTGGNIRKFPPK